VSETVGYAIAGWDILMEVDDKGRAWKIGKPFRVGPLNYLRVPTTGTFARRKAMLRRIAGGQGPAVFGLYMDLLELVAGMDRPLREGGVLRNVDGQPATLTEIADFLAHDHELVESAIAFLTDRRVGLLRTLTADDLTPDSAPVPGDSGEIPGTPGSLAEQRPGNPGISKAKQARANQITSNQSKGEERLASGERHQLALPIALRKMLDTFPNNPCIQDIEKALMGRTCGNGEAQVVADRVNRLLDRAREEAKEPLKWFVSVAQKGFDQGGLGVKFTKKRGRPRRTN